MIHEGLGSVGQVLAGDVYWFLLLLFGLQIVVVLVVVAVACFVVSLSHYFLGPSIKLCAHGKLN